MAPLPLFPQGVENFRVSQRSDSIILTWTNPVAYTDGSPLSEIREIEVWLVEEQKQDPLKISPDEPKKVPQIEAVIKRNKFPDYQITKDSLDFEYSYKLTDNNFTSKILSFAVRIKDKKGKVSALSNFLRIEPKIVPLPPQEIQYTLYEDSIEIRWKEPSKNIDNSSPSTTKGYNIYRKEEGGRPRRLNSALIKEKKFRDNDFFFDKVYDYFVRASSTESLPFAESDNSEIVKVLAKDIFAPAAPSGLVSLTGENFITLSWDENQERDLFGYRVWRREEGQEEYTILTPEPFLGNTYVDSTVEKNKRYYYAITAQDKNGNESEKSEVISQITQEVLL